jgi:UPF0176 protein
VENYTEKYKVILFYKYVFIEDPKILMYAQKDLCAKFSLKGRIILSKEGINGTVEGIEKSIEAYCKKICEDPRFSDIHFKVSKGNGKVFSSLSIKVREEIVSGHLKGEDVDPNQTSGKRISPEELHQWFKEKKDFSIVDMRNDYEQAVGHFEGSVLSGMKNFRDLSLIMPSLQPLKEKTVVTVCTGGVRCEKASGYLIQKGFKDIYQLNGGIVSYMEKYPSQNFIGSLYVFDGRIVMNFDKPEQHKTIGKCGKCGTSSERYLNCKDPQCHYHFICCEKCAENDGSAFCEGCAKKSSNDAEIAELQNL